MAALARLRDLTGVDTIPYDLARKPGQRFLNRSLGQTASVGLLTTHYDRLVAALGCNAVGDLLRGRSLVVAEMVGRSDAIYRFHLSRSLHHSREGELHLSLICPNQDRSLAGMTLVVGSADPLRPADLWIGGLQGCSGADSKTAVVTATRDLWGLRPKDALVHAAYALADVFHADRLIAVSNAGHARSRGTAAPTWRADYDAFWSELGAARLTDDFFVLPKAKARRSPGEVPSAKRKAWLNRYRLIDDAADAIRTFADRSRETARRPASELEAKQYARAVRAIVAVGGRPAATASDGPTPFTGKSA
jgi:hypothetical protein